MPLTAEKNTLLQGILRSTGVKSARKLRAEAVAKGHKITQKEADEAFRRDEQPAARQVLAPAQRPQGKSAAEAPGARLQADLMDFSRNTDRKSGTPYALQVTDVFTRKAYTKALPNKNSDTVTAALKILARKIDLPQGYTVSTDEGFEFAGLNGNLPKGGIHVVKPKGDRNALAVNDRTMQTLKQDLAQKVGQTGKGWANHLGQVTKEYNERSNSAVHGAPNEVGKENIQTFMVLQDNAHKFQHNAAVTQRRVAALESAGAFRAPVENAGRSFRPKYGAEREYSHTSMGQAVDTNGRSFLLKQVQPVPRGSGEPKGELATALKPPTLRGLAEEVAQQMAGKAPESYYSIGNRLKDRLGPKGITAVKFLKMFKDLFEHTGARMWRSKLKPSGVRAHPLAVRPDPSGVRPHQTTVVAPPAARRPDPAAVIPPAGPGSSRLLRELDRARVADAGVTPFARAERVRLSAMFDNPSAPRLRIGAKRNEKSQRIYEVLQSRRKGG